MLIKNKRTEQIGCCLQSSEVADQLLRTNTRHQKAPKGQSPKTLKHNILPLT